MTPQLRLAKNTAALIFLRVGVPALSVVLVFVLSRALGSEGLGRYTVAFTFLYFFTAVAPLGLQVLITRNGAREPASLESLLGNALTLGTIGCVALSVLMAVSGVYLGYDAATQRAISLLSLAIWPSTLATFLEGALIAVERMEYIAVSAVAESAVKIGIGSALLFLGYGLEAVLLTTVAGRVVACFVSAALLRRTGVRVRWSGTPAVVTDLLAAAPTFLLIQIVYAVYWRIDVFMLSKLRSVDDVGLYGAAWRLLELAIVLPQSLCLAVYPQIASASRSEPAALKALASTATRNLLAVSLPIAVGITIVARPALTFLYGPAFGAAGPTLAVLIWTVVPYGWVRYHAYALVAADRQRIDLALNASMAVVNVAMNIVLIPRYGYLGAAMATLACVCVYSVVQFLYLRRVLPEHLAGVRVDAPVLLATAAMGLSVWALRDSAVVLALAAGGVVYLGVLVATGFFNVAELRARGVGRLLGVTQGPVAR